MNVKGRVADERCECRFEEVQGKEEVCNCNDHRMKVGICMHDIASGRLQIGEDGCRYSNSFAVPISQLHAAPEQLFWPSVPILGISILLESCVGLRTTHTMKVCQGTAVHWIGVGPSVVRLSDVLRQHRSNLRRATTMGMRWCEAVCDGDSKTAVSVGSMNLLKWCHMVKGYTNAQF